MLNKDLFKRGFKITGYEHNPGFVELIDRKFEKRKPKRKRRGGDATRPSHLDSGPLVFCDGIGGDETVKYKYRDWRKKYDKFDRDYSKQWDYVVVLFGPRGSYDYNKFYQQNGWEKKRIQFAKI